MGDRVAYCSAGFGAYAGRSTCRRRGWCPIPEGIDFEQAAAIMLKGQTTEYLLQRTYPLPIGRGAACSTPPPAASAWCLASGRTVLAPR